MSLEHNFLDPRQHMQLGEFWRAKRTPEERKTNPQPSASENRT